MGIYDTIKLEKGIELPGFPIHLDPSDFAWQTKGLRKCMDTYKITSEGRLLRKDESRREKTTEEKDEMAREYTDGECESWEEWENTDTGPFNGPLSNWGTTVDETSWVDTEHHGTFEFHESGNGIESVPDVYWSYEARFTNGDLQDIVFMYASQI